MPKGRPRFTKTGRTYTPKNTSDYERILRKKAIAEMDSKQSFSGAVHVDVVFAFPIPKSASKSKKKELLRCGHTKRPDLDNLVKILDAFNGVVWDDDSQVCSLKATKIYSEEPYTVVRIWDV